MRTDKNDLPGQMGLGRAPGVPPDAACAKNAKPLSHTTLRSPGKVTEKRRLFNLDTIKDSLGNDIYLPADRFVDADIPPEVPLVQNDRPIAD